MKNLYILTLEKDGNARNVTIAGNNLNHAMERAERFGEMKKGDKLVDFTCAPLGF